MYRAVIMIRITITEMSVVHQTELFELMICDDTTEHDDEQYDSDIQIRRVTI